MICKNCGVDSPRIKSFFLGKDLVDRCHDCGDFSAVGGYPEFVPQRVHDERREHLADQIQSHRQGVLSKEWMELYPDRAKGSIDSGTISQDDVKKAEYTWKDLPNYNNLKKTKWKKQDLQN